MKERKGLFIQYREKRDIWTLRYPIYQEVYVSALKCILRGYFRDEERINTYQDISNIISFVGGRGSGKTTGMVQFCQLLSENKKIFDVLENKSSNLRFHCLDVVELSMLEEHEDIFELTLAKLLEGLESYERGGKDKRRELLQRFDKVYRSYHAVKYNQDRYEYGESSMSRLRNLSSSMGVKKEFSQLLEAYFDYLKEGEQRKRWMLVVPFDDLDLNFNHGYEMLEDIYRYMRHPNVIVLLAVDSEQLEYVCKNHIFRSFGTDVNILKGLSTHCEKLAGDFLAKVCPLDSRFYMPDIQSENTEVFEERDRNKENKDNKKLFIIKKYARKTGIYYDVCGRKKHFCEPENLRELVKYNALLDSLYDIDIFELPEENGMEIVRLYQSNFDRLYNDIVDRFAAAYLDVEQKRILDCLLQEDVTRWGRFWYGMCLENTMMDETEVSYEGMEGYPYHYGNLLKGIYVWGRQDNANKPLIHVLLALFSLQFTKDYTRHKYLKSQPEGTERLYGLLGSSFGGKWINEMIPRVREINGNYFVPCGFIPELLVGGKDFLNIEVFSPEEEDPEKNYISFSDEDIDRILSCIEEKKIVESLEVMAMFFPDSRDFEYEFKLKSGNVDQGERDTYKLNLVVHSRRGISRADFDTWGFVNWTLEEDRYKRLHKMIVEGISGALYDSILEYAGDIEEKCKKRLERTGLCHEKKMDVPVPFYNIDLTYNIFKRMRQKNKQQNIWSIPAEDMMHHVRRMYKNFLEEVEKEQKVYAGESSAWEIIKNNFEKCPFVDAVLNPEERLIPDFDSQMVSLLKRMITPAVPQPTE